MNVSAIASRALGAFPLSIATSLAIEGGLGIHPDNPMDTQPILDYDVIWVNIKTIFRNLYNAIERDEVLSVHPQEMYEAFSQEIEYFQQVVAEQTQRKVKVVLYNSDYYGMKVKYPNAMLRGDVTPLQQAYSEMMKIVVGSYVKAHKDEVRIFMLRVSPQTQDKVLMFTHYAYDLFAKETPRMALLESHTGAVKQKHQWYTKYMNGRDLPMIPFREDLIQVFGDSEFFRPLNIKVKKVVIDIAVKHGWSQTTTTDKIRYTLDKIEDKFIKDLVLSMIKHS